MELDRLTHEVWSAIKSPVLRAGLLNTYVQAFHDSKQAIETALDELRYDKIHGLDKDCAAALQSIEMAHRYMDDSRPEVAAYYKDSGLYDNLHNLMIGVVMDKDMPPTYRKTGIEFITQELKKTAPEQRSDATWGFLFTMKGVLAEGQVIKDGQAVLKTEAEDKTKKRSDPLNARYFEEIELRQHIITNVLPDQVEKNPEHAAIVVGMLEEVVLKDTNHDVRSNAISALTGISIIEDAAIGNDRISGIFERVSQTDPDQGIKAYAANERAFIREQSGGPKL